MMNDNFGAHFHLVVNDIPVLGFFLTTIFLFASVVTKERDGWARAAMLTLAISMVGLILAFFSGDPALKVIDGQPRTSARALTQHHIRGVVAAGLCVITSVIAVVGTVRARKRGSPFSQNFLIVVLIAAALSATALTWTGQAGGRINHPELQAPEDKKEGPAHPH